MTDDRGDTRTIIEELREALAKGAKLAVALEFAGKVEEARQVSAKVGDLRAQLDRLLTADARHWSTAGEAAAAELRAANRLLHGDIVDIKEKRDLPGTVTRALVRLEGMIADAKGFAEDAAAYRRTRS